MFPTWCFELDASIENGVLPWGVVGGALPPAPSLADGSCSEVGDLKELHAKFHPRERDSRGTE